MPDPIPTGGTGPTILSVANSAIVRVEPDRPMRRLLAFAGRSIDEVVNCPVARRHVIFYWRIGKLMARQSEVDDLERQWNPLGRRS